MKELFVPDLDAAVVRYQTSDTDRAIAFYTEHLGFRLSLRAGPIAILSRGRLDLLLSGPHASGGRPMPDGSKQTSGGWNRIVLYVETLEPVIAQLEAARAHFRNQIEEGPGGRQILVDDPDGNCIELHQAPRR
jgi:glyoxylase I family protein